MTKNVLAYLKKVVDAKTIRYDREETFTGGSLGNITYIAQNGRTYKATIDSQDLGETLYDNYGDIYKEQTAKKYGPLNLSKMLEYIETVSYTHLRAHETRHDLVCRLLLEKKKKK